MPTIARGHYGGKSAKSCADDLQHEDVLWLDTLLQETPNSAALTTTKTTLDNLEREGTHNTA